MELIEDDCPWEAYESAPDIDKVIRASTLVEDVIGYLHGPDEVKGAHLPWRKAADKLRLRAGETTLYAGINGHGKSLLTTQVALALQRQDEPVLIASMEMAPYQTMANMCAQASGMKDTNPVFIRKFHAWTDGKLWLYKDHGDVRPERLLAVMRYAAAELGIRHVFIDSLMKCVRGTDDYNGQKNFVNSLCDFAMSTQAHVHLVAHVRKGEKTTDDFDKFSIKGESEISDLVDNVVLVKRNKRKESLLEVGKFKNDEAMHAALIEPDCFFDIDKQRHFSWEGSIGLFFDRDALGFVEKFGDRVASQVIT